jgi:hypothetical protein
LKTFLPELRGCAVPVKVQSADAVQVTPPAVSIARTVLPSNW